MRMQKRNCVKGKTKDKIRIVMRGLVMLSEKTLLVVEAEIKIM